VFQDDLLFPHLSAADNLRYGHDLLPPAQRRFAFGRIADLLELGPLLERRPAQLSGGERQRVALGRALLASPRLLLMDEPLSSLDQGLKSRIIPYLRHIRSELSIPILYVSHSVAEILELTGQVIFLDQGEVVAQGDFFHLAHHPRVLPLVEQHGFENVLPVEVLGSEAERGFSLVRHGGHQIKIPLCDRPPGSRIFIGIRADDIILCRQRPQGLSVRNYMEGQVAEVSRVGGKGLVYVDVGKRLAVKVTAEAIDELGLEVGQQVVCLIKTHSIRIGPEVE
jgi:molybdate transport system ATP-binding protein